MRARPGRQPCPARPAIDRPPWSDCLVGFQVFLLVATLSRRPRGWRRTPSDDPGASAPPSAEPSGEPSAEPTAEPTRSRRLSRPWSPPPRRVRRRPRNPARSQRPTTETPCGAPTAEPTIEPTPQPTVEPTPDPTPAPTLVDYIVTFAAETSAQTQLGCSGSRRGRYRRARSPSSTWSPSACPKALPPSMTSALTATSGASSRTRSAPPRLSRPIPTTVTSGRCRRSAGTRSSVPSRRAARRSSPCWTPAWMPRIRSLSANWSRAPRSWTAPARPPTSTATAPRWPGSSLPRPITAPASRASGLTASGSCRSRSSTRMASARTATIIEGVVWAVGHGADVINMSFSNPGYSPSLQAAIDYAWANDVVVVAATGNDGSSSVTFPAGDRGVIGVSSTDQSDALAGSSNYGESVFLAAPGVGILTTAPGGGSPRSRARPPPRRRSPRRPHCCARWIRRLRRGSSWVGWPGRPMRRGPSPRPATAG